MLQIETEPLFDLVAHTFCFIPLRDNSSLYSGAYIDFVKPFLQEAPLRTLLQDAAMLASLYEASPGACALQFFSSLVEGVEAFTASIHEPFGFLLDLPGELVELFRIALFGELQAGFLSLREERIAPLFASGVDCFAAQLSPLCARWPGLSAFRWLLSAPLGCSGRLLSEGTIAVGLPGFLEARVERIVLQACHEYFLSVVQRFAPRHASFQSASFDDEGFYGAEITTLSISSLCWRDTSFAALFAEFVSELAPVEVLQRGALVPRAWRRSFEEATRLLL